MLNYHSEDGTKEKILLDYSDAPWEKLTFTVLQPREQLTDVIEQIGNETWEEMTSKKSGRCTAKSKQVPTQGQSQGVSPSSAGKHQVELKYREYGRHGLTSTRPEVTDL